MFGLFKQRRRRQLRSQLVPNEWRSIISRNLPFFNRLAAADQRELLGHVQVFLAEKRFEGCGGLRLTDEIRVTIATQACLLLLHRRTDYYPRLVTILVYPSGYVVDEERHVEGHIWEEGREGRLGETGREMGSMVLAWDAAKSGASDPSDGKNLVLHEFAHQLDFEDFIGDGVPALGSRREKLSWAEVMKMEFAALRAADATGISTLLDTYGATNAAEFFAVATEAFFERPQALQQQHPRLYGEMRRFFRQDPARYSSEPAARVSGCVSIGHRAAVARRDWILRRLRAAASLRRSMVLQPGGFLRDPRSRCIRLFSPATKATGRRRASHR